jgi:transcriptional regulator with XRE-family HTH domain
MDPRRIVGTNLRRAREGAGLSQRAFGESVGRLLNADGTPWPRQTVSAAEHGDRAFNVTEVMAFALITRRNPEWFLTPREPWAEIDFPGASVSWLDVSRSSTEADGPTRMELAGAIEMLAERSSAAADHLHGAIDELEALRQLSGYFQGLELARSAVDIGDRFKGIRLIAQALNQMGDWDGTTQALEKMAELMRVYKEQNQEEEGSPDGDD